MKFERIKGLLSSRWGRVAVGLSVAVKILLVAVAALSAAGHAHAQVEMPDLAALVHPASLG